MICKTELLYLYNKKLFKSIIAVMVKVLTLSKLTSYSLIHYLFHADLEFENLGHEDT